MRRQVPILTASIRRAINLIWLSDRGLALWHTVIIVMQALLPLAMALILKQVIDIGARVVHGEPNLILTFGNVVERFGQDKDFRALSMWLGAGSLFLLASLALRLIVAWVAEFHALAVTEQVYTLLHEAMSRVDYGFFENTDDQNRLYMAREEALYRPTRVLSGFGQGVYGLVSIAGVLVILTSLTLWLPLLMLLAAVPSLALKLRRSQRFYGWRKSLTPLEREAGYFHSVLSDNVGARDIRVYQHGQFCTLRFRQARARLREARLAWRRYALSREAVATGAGILAVGLCLLLMTSRLLAGAATIGALVLCAQAAQRGYAALNTMLNVANGLFEDALFLQSFEELLSHPATITRPPMPAPVPDKLRQGIAFENVTFTYPGCTTPVLRNFSCRMLPGERVFLEGSNGSGKSTIIKLLCRLYDPEEGRILVDGIDLREFDPYEWRRSVGVLPQDFNHYQLTVRDNIRIGDISVPPEAAAIEGAAAQAGLLELIKSWPQGMETLLGRWLHTGVEPSVGQWQKVALARALLRPALLYALDEPASALDSQGLRELLSSLAQLAPGRVVLFTSHRELPSGSSDRIIRV